MKTLKENWEDVLPAIIAIAIVVVMFIIVFWGVSKFIPTPEEQKQFDAEMIQKQIRIMESIKLCQDNGLEAYRGEDSYWYCSPNK